MMFLLRSPTALQHRGAGGWRRVGPRMELAEALFSSAVSQLQLLSHKGVRVDRSKLHLEHVKTCRAPWQIEYK